MTSIKTALCLAICMMVSCSEKKNIEGFDSATWKSDRYGCAGERAAIAATLPEWKDQLLGASADEVFEQMGKPDQQELHKRNQKFYYYFYTNGSQCQDMDDEAGKRIFVRFSALNRVTEINYKFD